LRVAPLHFHFCQPLIRNLSRLLTLTLAVGLVLGTASSSYAQKPKPGRKVIATVKPEYPETLRFAQIGGLVKLTATVQADGTVTQVEVRGGNPILAEKAQAAVMKWKFAPGPSQTVEDISLSFSPH
jgi:TonB family protein